MRMRSFSRLILTSFSALNNLAYLYTERLNDLDKAYELARKARDLQGQ